MSCYEAPPEQYLIHCDHKEFKGQVTFCASFHGYFRYGIATGNSSVDFLCKTTLLKARVDLFPLRYMKILLPLKKTVTLFITGRKIGELMVVQKY